ncbi:hypothetical protein QUG98_05455 [Curtobacterium sp. RHCJP20]|uniref:Uncharacterized protein n=1 Tax=Curtobacterium subtropicum TaxID=3055138 RepID=A0ABT7TEA0_9MICO|nr:hypothetical protein [Curtobacterium subtropicum]MDM7887898.1 hypothetical protein [Curtobacterium subtropicum]
MAGRAGDWAALDEPGDPITTQPAKVLELAAYYRDMAESMETTAATLEKVGSGDESVGKGEAVDAVRKRAKDVAGSLKQMTGRYRSAGEALTGFAAAVGDESDRAAGTVMGTSWQALQDAIAAKGDLGSAQGLADPVADAKAGGKEPTPEDTADSQKRDDRISGAEAAVAAAKRKLQDAREQLNAAGRTAASTMRDGWHDGLHDSGWYKFIHMLIKILTIIGIVLAVFAFLIPGLGIGAILGAISAGMTLIAQAATFAMGEGNVFDLVMAVVGVLTLGLGTAITKVTSTAVSNGIKATKGAMTTKFSSASKAAHKAVGVRKDELQALKRDFSKLDKRLDRPMSSAQAQTITKQLDGLQAQISKATRALERARGRRDAVDVEWIGTEASFAAKFADNPNWWNVAKIHKVIANDAKLVKKQFWTEAGTRGGLKDWGERLGGVDFQFTRDRLSDFEKLNRLRSGVTAAPWYHAGANGFMSAWGKGNAIAGLVIGPIGIGADQERPWTEWVSEHKHPVTDLPTVPAAQR